MYKDTVIHVDFTLKNAQGEVIDSSNGAEPLVFLFGHNNIIDGLENAIAKHEIGDEFEVEVAPEDAYGLRNEDAIIEMPKSDLPDDFEAEVGMQIVLEDEEENPFPVWICGISEEALELDCNHPLASETLFFKVKILEKRIATKEELAHGHVHGPDGHAH